MTDVMGIGKLGSGTHMLPKKKFRWTAEWFDLNTGKILVMPMFVKLHARPNIPIEEINFLNEKTWIPGGDDKESITITYCDCNTDNPDFSTLWKLLSKFYDMTGDGIIKEAASEPVQLVLRLLDGCGNELESWQINNIVPSIIIFGGGDYDSGCDIGITSAYKPEDIKYINALDNNKLIDDHNHKLIDNKFFDKPSF